MSGDFTVTSIMTVVLCPATASALKKNTGLTELRLRESYFIAEVVSYLAQALHVNTTLRVLDLSKTTIHSENAEHLGKLSGGVWGYGLTGNIRQCQCATSNREMSVVKYCCHHALHNIPHCVWISHCYIWYLWFPLNCYTYMSTIWSHTATRLHSHIWPFDPFIVPGVVACVTLGLHNRDKLIH